MRAEKRYGSLNMPVILAQQAAEINEDYVQLNVGVEASKPPTNPAARAIKPANVGIVHH